jgi:hypothetical protein
VNYKEYFSRGDFKIRRGVWGYEIAPDTGTRHLQGYLEFSRSYRLNHVKDVLPSAHWEGTRGTALENYTYCCKSGNFDTLGDWNRENNGRTAGSAGIVSVGMMVMGLLSENAPIVRVSREYSEKWRFYEKTASYVAKIRQMHTLHDEWKQVKLCEWQYRVFIRLRNQSQRKVLWVHDEIGGYGKTWFAQFMNILYMYELLDGVQCSRDIAFLLSEEIYGFCVDTSRATEQTFDYNVLESLKNGYILTGKYAGAVKRFPWKPVAVFANYLPDINKLSADRWDIISLGEGEFSDLSKTPLYTTAHDYPYVSPPKIPILDDDFNLFDFLTNMQNPIGNEDVGVAGPSGIDIQNNTAAVTSTATETSTTTRTSTSAVASSVATVSITARNNTTRRTGTASRAIAITEVTNSSASINFLPRTKSFSTARFRPVVDSSQDSDFAMPQIPRPKKIKKCCQVHGNLTAFKKGCPCSWKSSRQQ